MDWRERMWSIVATVIIVVAIVTALYAFLMVRGGDLAILFVLLVVPVTAGIGQAFLVFHRSSGHTTPRT